MWHCEAYIVTYIVCVSCVVGRRGGTVCVIGVYIVCISHLVEREVAMWEIIGSIYIVCILRAADGVRWHCVRYW